ncbi:MAG: hypothetical protein IKP04_03065 [Candidatus Methanomethylophilaceae archaeon]|nr:hypothetical protein [Candidatus Methanomethylophilaceae archaeon]
MRGGGTLSRHKGMHRIHQILREHPGCIPWPIPDFTKMDTFYCDAEVADELIPLLRKNGFIPRSIVLDDTEEIGFGPDFDVIECIEDPDEDLTDTDEEGMPFTGPQAERRTSLFQSAVSDLDPYITEEDRPSDA